MKGHRVEPETKIALLAGVMVVTVWFAWAWVIAPFFQGRIQAAYEAGADQAAQADQRVPQPATNPASGAEQVKVIAHRSNVHIEVQAQIVPTPEAPASGIPSTTDYFARLGQTGDLYGGANALFAALALVAVGWAGALQQRTLREARDTDAHERFEVAFFELLKLSREVIEGFERKVIVKGEKRTKKGYSALNGLASKLFKPKASVVVGARGSQEVVQRLVDIYKEDVYRMYPSALGPYFRLLFQTFQLVDQAPLTKEEKVRYANIARGQISEGAVLLNLHVIFDAMDPEVIQQQFLNSLTPSYQLIPDSSDWRGKWKGVITRDSLSELGKMIVQSAPVEKRGDYAPHLQEGFNNLCVSLEKVLEALDKHYFAGRYLIAVGKTEWDNLKWDDQSIAEKRNIINQADLVFTASENPAAYDAARKKLAESNVKATLLDCSDAHAPSNSENKDRVGNCFTWIKADATFDGLVQSITEFEDRVFIGDKPPKRLLVEANRTKYAANIRIRRKAGATLADTWFNVDMPLSHDLVAIIGNKGSGKSALADIAALAGDTKNFKSFSFLKDTRFRNPRNKLAQHFLGALGWHDGTESERSLDQDPSETSVERVKYLPQSYLETLCNELGDGGSATFDTELRKIIYTHVPEEARLGYTSMDDLLDFKVAEIDSAREQVIKEISKANTEILQTERRLTPEFKQSLQEQLDAKVAEFNSLAASKPTPVEDPTASEAAQEESKAATEKIQALEDELKKYREEEKVLREKKAADAKRQAVLSRIAQAITNHKKAHDQFLAELAPMLAEVGADLKASEVVELKIDTTRIDALVKTAKESIAGVDAALANQEPTGLSKRREAAEAAMAEIKSKLGEKQRLFILFKDQVAKWERAKDELVGSKEKPQSIEWFKAEIESLDALPGKLAMLRANRMELARAVHEQIRKTVEEYRRLYEPVQQFVKSAAQMEMHLPLDFDVRIEESNFLEQFFPRINRQSRGSFSGVDESNQLMRGLLKEVNFGDVESTLKFLDTIDDMLHFDRRESGAGRETRIVDQLRKGGEPQDILDYLYGMSYLAPRYSLTFDQQEISQLSPGERGLLLLVFYLLVDKDDIPIIIDQPEENLDNQTIFKVLVKCIKAAKQRRQVIMVTHNPNLAVVCDAEQIICATCDKATNTFNYVSGGIESPVIKSTVVEILEGTEPAFKNRKRKYGL